jgi:hypothetical protein
MDALTLIVDELSPGDIDAIVEYGSDARGVCDSASAKNRSTILKAINRLEPK